MIELKWNDVMAMYGILRIYKQLSVGTFEQICLDIVKLSTVFYDRKIIIDAVGGIYGNMPKWLLDKIYDFVMDDLLKNDVYEHDVYCDDVTLSRSEKQMIHRCYYKLCDDTTRIGNELMKSGYNWPGIKWKKKYEAKVKG